MSAAVHAVPETAPSHGGTGGHEIVHHPCCADQDIALCTTDVTDHAYTAHRGVTCLVCDSLRRLPCVKSCPLYARKEA